MSKNAQVVVNANVKEVINAQVMQNAKNALSDFAIITEIATENNIEKAVELFNTFADVDKTVDNLKKVNDMINSVNAEFKSAVVGKYALLNNSELLSALCKTDVVVSDKDNVKQIANKLKMAISYKFLYLKDDNGTQVLKSRDKAVTLSDIIDAKAVVVADKKADKTVTKSDTVSAVGQIIDSTTKGILYCALHTACKLANITDTKIVTTVEYNSVYKALQELFVSQGKENPFAKVSNNALQSQLEISVSTLFGNSDFDSKCTKAYAQMFYNMLIRTDNTNGLQIEQNDILRVLQALIIVCRYMHNNIKPMIQLNKTIHTTK